MFIFFLYLQWVKMQEHFEYVSCLDEAERLNEMYLNDYMKSWELS